MGERSSGIGRSDVNTLVAEVQRQYFAEYTSRWEEALNDVHLKRLNGIGDSIDVARKLSQGDSPLRRLIVAANEQTTLSASPAASAVNDAAKVAAANAAKQATQNAASTLGGSLFGGGLGQVGAAAIDSTAAGGKSAPEAQLDVNFERLRRLVGDGKSGELSAALQLITEVYNELIAVDQKVKSGQALADASSGLTRMKASADNFPAPIAGMIKALTGTGAGACHRRRGEGHQGRDGRRGSDVPEDDGRQVPLRALGHRGRRRGRLRQRLQGRWRARYLLREPTRTGGRQVRRQLALQVDG